MKHIGIKDVREWEEIPPGMAIHIQGEKIARTCKFEFSTGGPVHLYIEEGEDRKYLCTVDGLAKVEFTANTPCYITTEQGDYPVSYKPLARVQVVEPTSDEVYTTLDYQGRRSTEFERMSYMVRENLRRIAETNERALQAQERRHARELAEAKKPKADDTTSPPKKPEPDKKQKQPEPETEDAQTGDDDAS